MQWNLTKENLSSIYKTFNMLQYELKDNFMQKCITAIKESNETLDIMYFTVGDICLHVNTAYFVRNTSIEKVEKDLSGSFVELNVGFRGIVLTSDIITQEAQKFLDEVNDSELFDEEKFGYECKENTLKLLPSDEDKETIKKYSTSLHGNIEVLKDVLYDGKTNKNGRSYDMKETPHGKIEVSENFSSGENKKVVMDGMKKLGKIWLNKSK